MATWLPFHRAIVCDPAFVADPSFDVHTRWIETEFVNEIEPFTGGAPAEEGQDERQNVVVEVGGRRLDVSLPAGFSVGGGGGAATKTKPSKRSRDKGGSAASGDAVAAPMQGTIVKVGVEDGQTVETGDLIVVLEAMKMENPVTAHKSGTVTGLTVASGDPITQGAVLCEVKD